MFQSSDFNQLVRGCQTERLKWSDVRSEVAGIEPLLAKSIDELDPNDRYRLYRCDYGYGAQMLDCGRFFLPNSEGAVVSIEDSSLDALTREDLSYNRDSNPLGLVLSNRGFELFIPMGNNLSTLGMCNAGYMIGLSAALQYAPVSFQPSGVWSLTSGARSTFMLPKVSESNSHGNLIRKYHIFLEKPDTFHAHWDVFRRLANHPEVLPQPWKSSILYFSREWFSHFQDPAWMNVRCILLDKVWKRYAFLSNVSFWESIFNMLHMRAGIRFSPYTAEIVKAILCIAAGALPGFSAAVDESALPLRAIQRAYLEVYKLKNYQPILMQPNLFDYNVANARSVYYSLQFPSAMHIFPPKSEYGSSAIRELQEVCELLQTYLEQLQSNFLYLTNTAFFHIKDRVKFEEFHSLVKSQRLSPIENLKTGDRFFEHANYPDSVNYEFPENSSFFRGCVRISQK